MGYPLRAGMVRGHPRSFTELIRLIPIRDDRKLSDCKTQGSLWFYIHFCQIALTNRNSSKTKNGSVGQLAPNMEAKLVDGELYCRAFISTLIESANVVSVRGPNVFQGYNNPEHNVQAFDEEGFMRTGDIVHVDEDGFIFVVDRVKEVRESRGSSVSTYQSIDDQVQWVPGISYRRARLYFVFHVNDINRDRRHSAQTSGCNGYGCYWSS